MPAGRRVRVATAWIDGDLTRDFSLSALAAAANVSASQPVRLFRKTLGVTPMTQVSALRITKASHQLFEQRA